MDSLQRPSHAQHGHLLGRLAGRHRIPLAPQLQAQKSVSLRMDRRLHDHHRLAAAVLFGGLLERLEHSRPRIVLVHDFLFPGERHDLPPSFRELTQDTAAGVFFRS